MVKELWTIEQLQHIVAAAMIAGECDAPMSGRVRAVPDTRTIRYYTMLGILDRPSEMRGRTAFYSRRHVEQLVAIKRLQAKGKSLVEVQEQLAAVTPRAIQGLAKIPREFWEVTAELLAKAECDTVASDRSRSVRSDAREEFWAAPVGDGVVTTLTPCVQLRFAGGVTLSIDNVRPDRLPNIQTDSVQRAVRVLVRELEQQGLISGANRAPRIEEDLP
jgi:DNA-binding transcriptional MerR regulator